MRLSIVAPLAIWLSACSTNYHYIVRTEDAPLYADETRSMIIARMERFEDGYIGHSPPEGDPIEIEYRGIEGWANREDLRIFAYPNNDYARAEAVALNRREVILEGKDWPPSIKQAIRESRLEKGMTREQVELAWGHATHVSPIAPQDGGGERWVFEHTEWDVHEHVDYLRTPGFSTFYYGYPCGWGYVYEFPYYEPVYYRTYYPRLRRRTATFDAEGRLAGWSYD